MSKPEDPPAGVHEHGGVRGYEPEFVDVDGVRTRYYDVGDPGNDTLVLVHGGNWSGSSNANTWAPTYEYLRDDFRVLAFDRIGCGMTDNPDRPEDYRYRTELDHALAFLETMDVSRCHIGGSSRGAGLAARMAVEEPKRFDTLVLVNSGTLGPGAGDLRYRYDRLFPTRGDNRLPVDWDPADVDEIRHTYVQYSYRLEHCTDEYCRTSAYLRNRPKALRTAEIMEKQGRQEHWEQTMLEQMKEARRRIEDGVLTVPTLYTFGRNDLTVRLETAIAAFDLIAQSNPDVRLKLFNQCGHLVHREYPEEFSRSVVEFVQQWHS